MGSFQAALSALKATSIAIDAVGNNLANINTTGFKRSTVSFSDVMNGVGSSPDKQVGGGVNSPNTNRQFIQGNVSNTSVGLDAAIQGNGFFVVKPPASAGSVNNTFAYTRDGQFHISGTGQLVTGSNARVQGWLADPTTGLVDTTGAVQDLNLPIGSVIPPIPTSTIDISANLDASSATGKEFTFPLQVIDSLGGAHQFQLKATKNATAGTWDLSLSSDDPTVEGGEDLSSKLSVTSLAFINGTLDPASDPEITISGLTYTSDSGVPAQGDIVWNLWQVPPSGTPPTGGVSGLTQFSQSSAISRLGQNGSPAGTLSDVSIANGGLIMATYSNGLQKQVGQLALGVVQNPASLLDMGGNIFRPSADSNVLPPSGAAAGGGGQIVGQSLEASNVDIAQEFTDLITYQRSYQASSKVITTIDQLTMDTLNLKQ